MFTHNSGYSPFGLTSSYNVNLTNSYAGYPGYSQSSYISYPPAPFGNPGMSSSCEPETSLGYGLSVDTSSAMKSDIR